MSQKTQSNNDTLSRLIADTFALKIGVSIEIAGSLYIRELDNGYYIVGGEDGLHDENTPRPKEGEVWPEWESEELDLDSAIQLFIDKRNENKYGDDFWPIEENG